MQSRNPEPQAIIVPSSLPEAEFVGDSAFPAHFHFLPRCAATPPPAHNSARRHGLAHTSLPIQPEPAGFPWQRLSTTTWREVRHRPNERRGSSRRLRQPECVGDSLRDLLCEMGGYWSAGRRLPDDWLSGMSATGEPIARGLVISADLCDEVSPVADSCVRSVC